MIASLRGVLLERGLDQTLVVEVGGVGYEVVVTPRTAAAFEPGAAVFLHVHHHLREDAQTLFGFPTRDERATFRVLIGTHGVGPAMAMSILATHPPATLAEIVSAGDLGALTLVPGVGKKTAERLLVELRSRLSTPVLDGPSGPSAVGASVVGDVREALIGLGYGAEEIREALHEPPADEDAAALLRVALERLAARRA